MMDSVSHACIEVEREKKEACVLRCLSATHLSVRRTALPCLIYLGGFQSTLGVHKLK